MCPPPCGPRRSYGFIRNVVRTERIAKRDVDAIIDSDDFVCLFKPEGEKQEQAFNGSVQDLHRILHDRDTSVKVVGSRFLEYRYGWKTIVMFASCVSGRVILRLGR